jgi:uncharacterized membrane protein
MTTLSEPLDTKLYGWLLAIAGLIGLIASTALTLDNLKVLINPNFVPGCSINPIISCGTVMKSASASAFGVPNSWLGLIGFTAVMVVGVSLLAGATFKPWYWRLFNLGMLGAVVLTHWLMLHSLYVIHALCPWCMVVWTVTIPIVLYTTLRNLRTGDIPTPKPLTGLVKFLLSYKNLILVLWYLIIITMIIVQFWYYWRTLL